jgi:hypothetical protein
MILKIGKKIPFAFRYISDIKEIEVHKPKNCVLAINEEYSDINIYRYDNNDGIDYNCNYGFGQAICCSNILELEQLKKDYFEFIITFFITTMNNELKPYYTVQSQEVYLLDDDGKTIEKIN